MKNSYDFFVLSQIQRVMVENEDEDFFICFFFLGGEGFCDSKKLEKLKKLKKLPSSFFFELLFHEGN